jgi:hypothetical protein
MWRKGNLAPNQGRPPGSVAKPKPKTHLEFIAALDALDFDPLREAVALFRDAETGPREKVILIRDLMSYMYARRRSVEISGDVKHTALNISWSNDPGVKPPETLTIDTSAIAGALSKDSDSEDENDIPD